MKNLLKIFALSFLVTFAFSCKKSDSESVTPASPIQSESIVGKWKDAGTKGFIQVTYEGQVIKEPIDQPASNDVVEFKSNGTIVNLSTPGDGPQFTKYSTKNDQLILVGAQGGKSFEFIFTFDIKGGNLVLSMDKKLFVKNLEVMSKAGIVTEFEDMYKFLTYITEMKYDHSMVRQ
jgi:hypothetical protein